MHLRKENFTFRRASPLPPPPSTKLGHCDLLSRKKKVPNIQFSRSASHLISLGPRCSKLHQCMRVSLAAVTWLHKIVPYIRFGGQPPYLPFHFLQTFETSSMSACILPFQVTANNTRSLWPFLTKQYHIFSFSRPVPNLVVILF